VPVAAIRSLAARLARNPSGATALEFALITPAMIMTIFGTWYLGWALNCGGEVRHAVELASRLYIQNPNTTLSQLSSAVSARLDAANINQVTLAASSQTIGTATVEHITWSYTATAPIPMFSTISIPLSGVVDVPMASP
jgi:Flp pilus assembly protein TadG